MSLAQRHILRESAVFHRPVDGAVTKPDPLTNLLQAEEVVFIFHTSTLPKSFGVVIRAVPAQEPGE